MNVHLPRIPGQSVVPVLTGCTLGGLRWVVSAVACLCLQLAASPAFAAGGDLVQAFDAANKLYEAGRFNEAAAAYEGLLQGGAVSTALYYNWGNAQFKAGHLGRAIAAYRRAENLSPRDADIRANLQFARQQVQGATLRPGWQERGLGALTLTEWSVAVAAALWTLFGLLIARQINPRLQRPLRSLTFAVALLVALLGAALSLALRDRLATQTAIVLANDVAVRNGPFEESPTAFTAQDGAELRVLDRKDDWLQVTAGPRRVGWLPRQNVVVAPTR